MVRYYKRSSMQLLRFSPSSTSESQYGHQITTIYMINVTQVRATHATRKKCSNDAKKCSCKNRSVTISLRTMQSLERAKRNFFWALPCNQNCLKTITGITVTKPSVKWCCPVGRHM